MTVLKIIKDDFYWDDSLSEYCYRLIAEEENGCRSFSYLIPFVGVEFWQEKIFCGETKFQFVATGDTCLSYTTKFGNYFSNAYKVHIMNPNQNLTEKIKMFNKAKSLNPLLEKHNKPLLSEPVFILKELVGNSELVFVEGYYFGEDGFSILFFESPLLNTKKYIQDYFKENHNLEVLDCA